MASHTITTTHRNAAGTLTATKTLTNIVEINVDETIAASTTNHEIDVVIDVSAVVMLAIYCDRAVTIKTNSTGSPADTIALPAGDMITWYTGRLDSLILTTDVTKIYVTTPSGAVSNFSMRILLDLSP